MASMHDVDPELIEKLTEVDIMSEFPTEVREGIKKARIRYFALFEEFKKAIEAVSCFDEVFAQHCDTYFKTILDDKIDRIRMLEPHKRELMTKLLDSIFSMNFDYHGMTIYGSKGGKCQKPDSSDEDNDEGKEKGKKGKKHKKHPKGKKKGSKRGKSKKREDNGAAEKWTGRAVQETTGVKTVEKVGGKFQTTPYAPVDKEKLHIDYGQNRYHMECIYEKMKDVCGAVVDILEADFYQSRDHVFKGLADIFAKLAEPLSPKEGNFEKMQAIVELVSSATTPKRDYSMYGGEMNSCERERAKQEREQQEEEGGVIITDITNKLSITGKVDGESDNDDGEETTCTCSCHGPCPCCCSGCYPINHRELIEKNGGEQVKIVKKGLGILPPKEEADKDGYFEDNDENASPKIEEIVETKENQSPKIVETKEGDSPKIEDAVETKEGDSPKINEVVETKKEESEVIQDSNQSEEKKELFFQTFRNSVGVVDKETGATENHDASAEVVTDGEGGLDTAAMNHDGCVLVSNDQHESDEDETFENIEELSEQTEKTATENSFSDSERDSGKETDSTADADENNNNTKKRKSKKEMEDDVRNNFNDSDNCSHCCCHCGCNRKFDIEMPDVDDYETFATVLNDEMTRFSPANRGFLFNVACTVAQPHSHILLKQKVVEVAMPLFLKLLKELKVDYQLYVVELVFKIVMSMQVARKFCFRDPDYFPALARLLGVVDPCKNRDRNQLRGDAAHVLYVSLMGSNREYFEKVAQTNAFENLVLILYEEPFNERDVQSGEDVFSCFNLFTDEWDLFIHNFQAAPMYELIDRWRRYALEYTSYLPNFIWMLESLKKRLICVYQAHRVSRYDFRLPKTFNADKLKEHNQIGCSNIKCYRINYPELGLKYKKCSKCHLAYYCSKECQLAHWRKHKKYCEKPGWLIEEEKQAKIDKAIKNIDFSAKVPEETEVTQLMQDTV